ncbi:hypothetical protein COCMIDRAFT_109287 [Bipolaris oryzae ATCC 44560]|uniref:Cupin type-2 domain-containing protein n=1 Tax=Bipolaris oryzae ATCC 44560 TaxID=930090 RepID=W6YXJ6_COCMI|nr:uncharacterized protein COCMIDRAFT_109287 [Bipolaris oryzae ATCC 44560]EUC40264.1 hypothetical protein COCMIDRAFT_109287 [Bipolaris oryzae ATCC 44560]
MSIPISTIPPASRTTYMLDQLEGERLTLPGSKGVFRILASSKQTNGGIAVFTSGAVLSDAPGFHWHQEAHDVFLVTKGFLKLWNGDKCRILGPGDFAYVPPKVIHNPELLGPHTETFGLVAPGDWVDFFRYVGETYGGVIVPENDNRDLKSMLIPKLMASKDRFDVHFERDHKAPEVGPWEDSENQLPAPGQAYFLRANTGPRWILGGVLSRPFIHAEQTGGKFAISSVESSNIYDASQQALARWLTFSEVDHCFCVQEGLLRVRLQSSNGWSEVREGQTLVVAAGETFSLDFGSRYVRVWSFTNGPGIEELIKQAGKSYDGLVIPDVPIAADGHVILTICEKLNISSIDL